MRLYSYVVARDYGFAPNPFGSYCTLATCKPGIREHAEIGDWVVGTGSARLGNRGSLIFAMKVSEKIKSQEYWIDHRFYYKRPVMNGSLKQMYGDNIYSRDKDKKKWIQADSHHSKSDGRTNYLNLKRDLKSKYVLISNYFFYFGKDAVKLPTSLSGKNKFKIDLCVPGQGYKNNFPDEFITTFVQWLENEKQPGYHSDPCQFNIFERYGGKS